MPIWRGNDDQLGVGDGFGDFALLTGGEQPVGFDTDYEGGWEKGKGVSEGVGLLGL